MMLLQVLMQSVVQMLSSFLYNLAPESSLGRRPAYLVRRRVAVLRKFLIMTNPLS